METLLKCGNNALKTRNRHRNSSSEMAAICFLQLFSLASIIMIATVAAKNSFTLHQTLKNGETLISSNNRFELGFFNVSSESNRESKYLGIWYRGINPLTAVWVANRMEPFWGARVELHINSGGDLLIRDDEGNAVCFVRLNQSISRPSLILLDSGNLVLKDGSKDSLDNYRYAWQSFESPSDTLLPGMKLGWDLKSGSNRVLTSWGGGYVFGIETPSLPQLVLERNGAVQSRWGPWNGERFSGSSINIRNNRVFRVVYHYGGDGVYIMLEMWDDSILLRLVVTSVGTVQFFKWANATLAWVPVEALTNDVCDKYGWCGPYATCQEYDQGCRCLKGFVVNSPADWRTLDFSGGCRRKNPLNCGGDGFVKYTALKLPNNFSVLAGVSSESCADYCLKECTCMAYTSISMYGRQPDCLAWLDELNDIRVSARGGDEIYIRMARVELGETLSDSKREVREISTISSVVVALLLLGAAAWFAESKLKWLPRNRNNQDENTNREVEDEDQYVQLFSMDTVSAATRNFALENKIGQGGFGPVYQGTLGNEQKVAVKRLSRTSNQGLQEFKNEVNLIAQLQHRNLVKLLGCCIQGEERMLIYEYMPNKSLDQFIFDPSRKSLLNWENRLNILKGVAKGLDYLHFGSRMRVVHRDLKASNVLLDEQMNPRISDFGLARSCKDEIRQTTRRVIGTYGYMSPEYVLDGHYSSKSDVFSYGVLVIETVSGLKSWGFQHPDHEVNLIGHAWRLWNEGRIMEMMDPVLEYSKVEREVSRCFQIGLMCVQHLSEERPMMSQVVSMLENEDVGLVEPHEPGFYKQILAAGLGPDARTIGWMRDDISVNGLTVTELTGRTINHY